MNSIEAIVFDLASFAQLLFEAASILTVLVGGAVFVYALVQQATGISERTPRQVLARYLIIALELQLAADIIATATHPSFEELVKLAAIAVIRTFLNYFLVLEVNQESKGAKAPKDAAMKAGA